MTDRRRLADLVRDWAEPRSRRDVGAALARLALGAGLVGTVDAEARKKGKKKPKPCRNGTKRCGKKCFSLQTDRHNCGRCGNACGFSTVCDNGSCVPGCTVCAAGCSFSDIQDAVAGAASGAAISIAPGTYAGGVVVGKDLALQRCGDSGNVVIRPVNSENGGNGGLFARSITILADQTVTLENLTLTGGGIEVGGGGLENAGITAVTGCTIRDCSRPGEAPGGGILNTGELTMIESVITGNAAANGGGIANAIEGTLSLTFCEITDNRAVEQGAGIRNNGELTVVDCRFTGNDTESSGGAIANHGEMDLTNLTVRQNHADVLGGGIFNLGPTRLEGCVITRNTTDLWGGGIYNTNATASLTFVAGCTVSDNSAGENGGGIYNSVESTVVFQADGNTLISGNTAVVAGGGILNDFKNAVTFESNGGTVTLNTARRGGGIYNGHQSTVTLASDGVAITENTATSEGGGIFNSDGGAVTLNGASVSDNLPNNCAGDEPVAGCTND
jgi:hypothetical protein